MSHGDLEGKNPLTRTMQLNQDERMNPQEISIFHSLSDPQPASSAVTRAVKDNARSACRHPGTNLESH